MTPAELKEVINILPPLDSMVFSPPEKKCFEGISLAVITDGNMLFGQCQQKKNGRILGMGS